MEVLNNYFIGLKSIDNISEVSNDTSIDTSSDTSIVHEYLSETTQGYGKLFVFNESESYIYNGQIINGQITGSGLIKFINDKRYPEYKTYQGELLNGKFNGTGTIVYTNGDIFVGFFTEGKKNGQGKMYSSNGDLIMDNIWKNDVVCGKVKYVEYFHNSKQVKVSGILFNSVKIGTWLYHRENGTIEKIEYYKDCDLSESDESITATLEKTLFTYDSGYIIDQMINFEKSISIEELCMGSYTKYDTKLMSDHSKMPKVAKKSLDKNTENTELDMIQFYDTKIKEFAIPSKVSNGALVLCLNNKGNIDSIKEYINGSTYDKMKILQSNLFSNANNKNNNESKQYYLVNTNTFDEKTNSIETKSAIYMYDCINNSIPMLYYEGNIKANLPDGSGNIYENGKIKYSGNFENGQLIDGMQFSSDSSDGSDSYIYYVGKFKNNMPHGEGSYFNKIGIKIYEGEINDGKYHGNGISYWETTGAMNWNGRWRNHQKHGKGKLYDDNGALICSCAFEHDQMSHVE